MGNTRSVLDIMAETARETAKLPPERRREFVRAEQRADPFAAIPEGAVAPARSQRETVPA